MYTPDFRVCGPSQTNIPYRELKRILYEQKDAYWSPNKGEFIKFLITAVIIDYSAHDRRKDLNVKLKDGEDVFRQFYVS